MKLLDLFLRIVMAVGFVGCLACTLYAWYAGQLTNVAEVSVVQYRLDRLTEHVDQVVHVAQPAEGVGTDDLRSAVERCLRRTAELGTAFDTLVTISPAPRGRVHVPVVDGVRVGLSYVPAEDESVDGRAKP